MGIESTDGGESDSGYTSVPDAWIYSNTRAYCILIEAKAGSYPLEIAQLEAHTRDWFDSNLESLKACDSLCSVV